MKVNCPFCGKEEVVECESGDCKNVVTICEGCNKLYGVDIKTGEVFEV